MNVSLSRAGRVARDGEMSLGAPVCRTGDGAPVHPNGRSTRTTRSIRTGAAPANLSAMSSTPRTGVAGSSRSARLGSRALGLVLAVPTLLMLFAVPALAGPMPQPDVGNGDIGDVHSPTHQSLPVMIGLYVGIPALGFLIAILLAGRSGRKSDRYRPGQPWKHDPAWFGSSEQDAEAVQEQRRRAALPGAGGASGRW